ncbi:hypothetical protein DFH29DRAFT_872821 [Suillus ampliporus]|nr:hypothetical protein DFH29DRAFT_872821 [Suillus ampliporus]
MLLVELKMYLHEEHIHTGSVRKCLKQHYCKNPTIKVNQSAESSYVTVEDDSGIDAFGSDPKQISSSGTHENQGLQQIAAHLIQAVEDKETLTTFKIVEAAANSSDFQRIAIKDLLMLKTG